MGMQRIVTDVVGAEADSVVVVAVVADADAADQDDVGAMPPPLSQGLTPNCFRPRKPPRLADLHYDCCYWRYWSR